MSSDITNATGEEQALKGGYHGTVTWQTRNIGHAIPDKVVMDEDGSVFGQYKDNGQTVWMEVSGSGEVKLTDHISFEKGQGVKTSDIEELIGDKDVVSLYENGKLTQAGIDLKAAVGEIATEDGAFNFAEQNFDRLKAAPQDPVSQYAPKEPQIDDLKDESKPAAVQLEPKEQQVTQSDPRKLFDTTEDGYTVYKEHDKGADDYAKMSSEDLRELSVRVRTAIWKNEQTRIEHIRDAQKDESLDSAAVDKINKEETSRLRETTGPLKDELKEITSAAEKAGMGWVNSPSKFKEEDGIKTFNNHDMGVEDYAKMSSIELRELHIEMLESITDNHSTVAKHIREHGVSGSMDELKASNQSNGHLIAEAQQIRTAARQAGYEWAKPPEEQPEPKTAEDKFEQKEPKVDDLSAKTAEQPDPAKAAAAKIGELEGKSPDEVYNALQEYKIEVMKATDPDVAKGMQVVHDNPDKTIYMDTRNGAEVTILDGDKETIKPYLEHSYEQGIAWAGGVDKMIEKNSALMEEKGMPEAVIAKEAELMREANGDGAKYAELRFESNDFFREQAIAGGKNPEMANDSIASWVVPKTTLEIEKLGEDGQPIENKQAPEPQPERLAFDEKALVPLHENGKLTNVGGTITGLQLFNEVLPPHRQIDTNTMVESSKDFFEAGMKEHGSVEAFAEHVKTSGVPGIPGLPGSGIDPVKNADQCQEMADAILKSEGKPEYFAAEAYKSANKVDPEELAQKNTRDALLANQQEQEAAADTKSDGPGMDFGNLDLKEILEMLVSIFKGGLSVDQAMAQITNKLENKDQDADNKKEAVAEKVETSKEAGQEKVVDASKPQPRELVSKLTTHDHPVEKEEPEIKDKESANEQEDQYVHYEQTKQTAGAPVVNKDGDSYIALKTEDGGQKTLQEGFNDTSNDPPTTRIGASFAAIKHQFGFLSSSESKQEQQQPEHHNDENTANMGGSMGC